MAVSNNLEFDKLVRGKEWPIKHDDLVSGDRK